MRKFLTNVDHRKTWMATKHQKKFMKEEQEDDNTNQQ